MSETWANRTRCKTAFPPVHRIWQVGRSRTLRITPFTLASSYPSLDLLLNLHIAFPKVSGKFSSISQGVWPAWAWFKAETFFA